MMDFLIVGASPHRGIAANERGLVCLSSAAFSSHPPPSLGVMSLNWLDMSVPAPVDAIVLDAPAVIASEVEPASTEEFPPYISLSGSGTILLDLAVYPEGVATPATVATESGDGIATLSQTGAAPEAAEEEEQDSSTENVRSFFFLVSFASCRSGVSCAPWWTSCPSAALTCVRSCA